MNTFIIGRYCMYTVQQQPKVWTYKIKYVFFIILYIFLRQILNLVPMYNRNSNIKIFESNIEFKYMFTFVKFT